jgi:RNA polymerase sigma factor (sigma-70 family)
MMTSQTTPTAVNSDEKLVEWSLTGDRNAFRQIVERYQALVCSITYNATGSLTLSEDLAQETFVAAWKQLSELREPAHLRAWLCGITRFLVGKELRQRGREPIHAAEPLDAIHDPPSPEPSPSSQAVSREEEAILWRALERIPGAYRQPLILFYREQQSVERVAIELELSEDAVKQRLSRGRKLLHEEVIAFVEGTLTRTAPGQKFSSAVLAALPMAATSAAAGLGMGAKGAAAAKSGFLAAWLATLAPFVGIFAGISSQWLAIRATTDARERRVRTIELIALWICMVLFVFAGQYAMRSLRHHLEWSKQSFFVAMAGFWWLYAIIFLTWFTVIARRSLAVRQQREDAGEITRLTTRTRVALLVGTHLAAFSWLISVAWGANDRTTAGAIAALMVGLGVWNFLSLRGLSGMAAARMSSRHGASCCVMIVLVLNLRLDVWLAARYGVSVAEFHHLFPMWIIPSLTLALALWIGLVLALTKPKRHS